MKNEGCCPTTMSEDCSTTKKCCWGTLIKGAIIGGIIMFAVYSASWMFLPFHKNSVASFKNEKAVATVLGSNAAESGVYMLPGMPADMKTKPADTKPTAFVVVNQRGYEAAKDGNCMMNSMLSQLLLSIFGAALLTKLLMKLSCTPCCPMKASFGIGLLIAVSSHVPNLIWFHFPLNYTLVGMADDIVAVTFAGAFISRFALKSGFCGMPKKKK